MWNGEIQVPNQPLPILIEFNEEEAITGTISIPVQNLHDFALSDILLEGNSLSFKMPLEGQRITFNGDVAEDKINGSFTQNGQSFPFELTKGDVPPDTPGEDEDFLTIETSIGTLYGSLLLPEEGDAFPIALIIPGSGPTDRNGNSPLMPGENNSLKLLAEELASHGVASLRYDKRGAGKNAQAVPEAEEELDFEQFVEDAKQW